LCEALRASGIATWNVEYRRVGDPGGGWPNSFNDVLLAARYVHRLDDVRSEGAVLVGHSAGGHLALLAASELAMPVVAIAAATDFDAWEPASATAFLGDSDRQVASPVRRLPLGVAQIVIHGTDDDQVPFWLSQQYVDAAIAVGDPVELVALQSCGHFEPVDPNSAAWPEVERAIQRQLSVRRVDE